MNNFSEQLALNDFEIKLFQAACYNLQDKNNSLRANNYAYALRSLLDEYMDRKCPPSAILNCDWYKNSSSPHIIDHVSNRQQFHYLFRAELSDFEINHMGLSDYLDKTISDIQVQYKNLCNLTHISASSSPLSEKQINEQISLTNNILEKLSSTYSACSSGIHERLKESYINDAVVYATVSEYIENLDTISGRYSVEQVDIEEIKIIDISKGEVTLQTLGTVDVQLMWGKGEDHASLDENFPLKAVCTCPIGQWSNLEVSFLNVDTSDWYGQDAENEL